MVMTYVEASLVIYAGWTKTALHNSPSYSHTRVNCNANELHEGHGQRVSDIDELYHTKG